LDVLSHHVKVKSQRTREGVSKWPSVDTEVKTRTVYLLFPLYLKHLLFGWYGPSIDQQTSFEKKFNPEVSAFVWI
jgi:hypothetical protein